MINPTLVISLFVAMASALQCQGRSQDHTHLQWSETTQSVSPNGKWEVTVAPVLTSEKNQTPVTLRQCDGSLAMPLLTLQRSADLYWNPDGKDLVIVDEPVANKYSLLFFDIAKLTGEQKYDQNHVNELVVENLTARLGGKSHVEFFLPSVVSLKQDFLVVSAGGATSIDDNGPMNPYCYGFVIDLREERIHETLSERDLRQKYGATCRLSP